MLPYNNSSLPSYSASDQQRSAISLPNEPAELRRTDTLIKDAMQGDGTLVRELTQHVTQAVQNDLRWSTRLAERDEFINTFFPDDPKFVGILKSLKSNSEVYDSKTKQWAHFPSVAGGGETPYYQPLQNLCNTIQGHYLDGQESPATKRVWLDRHSKKPTSFTNAAENRPDIVQLLGVKEVWEKHLESLNDKHETRMTRKKALEAQHQKLPELSKEELKDFLVYWCRSDTPIEVQPKKFTSYSSREVQATIQQLAGYMRQIFREQHDRKFVFGLILFHDCMSLWYCDRSGLLGVKQLVDINQDGLLFVRIISRLSTISYDDKGWDNTMRLYRQNNPIFSHELDTKDLVDDFKDSAYLYKTHWVLEIQGKTYVTIRALSLSRAEIMCGRGQLVWLAVNAAERKAAVIKHAWSPFTTRGTDESQLQSEAEMYACTREDGDNEDHYIGRVVAHQVVANTRTLRDFRKNLQSDSIPVSEEQATSSPPGTQEESTHIKITAVTGNLFGYASTFTERQLCRMALDDYGYPLKRFLSLRELLETVRDCINGHEFLLSKGIVHRDLSPTNLLICPLDLETDDFEPHKVVGRLIDLDHAKIDEEYCKNPCTSDELPKMKPDELKILTKRLQTYFKVQILEDTEFEDRIELDPELIKAVIYFAWQEGFDLAEARTAAGDYLSAIIKSFTPKKWREIQRSAVKRKPPVVKLDDLRMFG
ncbi:hypothetical protein D9758_011636 [Tetrapyrgos nigripes]|uniref:Fungal-type protein kinase domain-containing protein n=1 Tax=Tetrapyrgos nigripes TaxID=182062 RepID=A0A8H5CS85_9AGAR|nr:hypothetical protein D9758_011636 [Tetrapyrgos nigripes]